MTASDERPAKAKLYKLTETPNGSADKPPRVSVSGAAIPVQFNPTSLKLDRSNDTSGGNTTRAQRRNRPNEGHATLTLDLEFDTAEGGPDGQPLDVRVKTADVRQFAEPSKDNPKGPPPRLRFEWGTFRFDGIVTRLGEEIDYFSADGLPLRAKLSLTITGQDALFESNATGPGSRTDQGSSAPGGAPASTGPNAAPTRDPTQAVPAQDGESMQQLLSRLNADPAGWRSAMAGLSSPLGLTAGFPVQLGATAAVSAGIGVSAGFAAGLDVSAGAAAGVSTDGTVGFAAEAAAGFALSAGGGVAAVAGQTLGRQAALAAGGARGSFELPAVAATAATTVGASASVVPVNAVDPRAISYGYGVPLRPRVLPVPGAPPASAGLSARAERRGRDARSSTMRWSP